LLILNYAVSMSPTIHTSRHSHSKAASSMDTISSHGGSDTTRTRSSDVWAPPWSALSRTSSDSYSSKPARLHIGVADAKIAGEWTGVASRPARCSHTVARNWWLP